MSVTQGSLTKGRAVGIDLGTTNSLAAVRAGKGARVLRDQGWRTSAVGKLHFQPNGYGYEDYQLDALREAAPALWQAAVTGFLGLRVCRPDDRVLVLEPRLPESWSALRVRLRWHGARLHLDAQGDRVHVGTDRPVTVSVHGTRSCVEPPGGWVG